MYLLGHVPGHVVLASQFDGRLHGVGDADAGLW